MSKYRKIAKTAGIIIAASFAGRVIGLIREIVIATQFGASAKTDAFVMSVNIPEAIMNLFAGGALVSAFLPVFSSLLVSDREEEAWQVASGIFNILVLSLGVLAALGVVFAPRLVYLFAPGFARNPETFATTVLLTRITFPAMVFFGMETLFRGILHSFDRFAVPAFTPLALNLWIIFGATVLGGFFQKPITGLAVGFLIGSMTQAGMQLPLILKRGNIFNWGLNLRHPEIRKVGKLLSPLVFSEVFGRFNIVIERGIASFLFPGSIAALNFATKLIKLPIRTIGGSTSVAMFPTMSKHVAVGEEKEFWRTLEKAVSFVLFITMPIMIWFIVFRLTIVKVIFQRGAFGEQDTLLTSFVILFLGFEITAGSLGHVLNRVFFARQDTITPIIANIASIVVKICLSVSWVWWWYQRDQTIALAGLAFSTSFSSWLNTAILLGYLIVQKNQFRFFKLIPTFIWSLTASVILFGAIYLGMEYTLAACFSNVYGLYLKFAISLVGGGVLYFSCAYLMKKEEANMLISLISKRKKS